MKNIVLVVLALMSFSFSAFAETICGQISREEDRFYILMPGNASAQLYARNTWISKPLTDLSRVTGQQACVSGEWGDDLYVFIVLRVN